MEKGLFSGSVFSIFHENLGSEQRYRVELPFYLYWDQNFKRKKFNGKSPGE